MSDTWGKGSVNNNIGWGQAAGSATNNWGESQKTSWAGQTDIVGITSVSIAYSSSAFCADASDPTPTISNNAGVGTFSSTAGLVFISTTTGEVDISASTAGTYVITYTDTDAATATFNLTINALPTVIVSTSAGTICDGESTTLTASGASTYVWNDGNTDNPRTVSPTTTTLFTATGTDSNGCTSSGGTTITVNPQDSAAFSYAASSYCANGTDPTPTITGTAGGAFTSTAGLSINASTGEIDLDASTVGTYSITYTTTGVCPDNQSVNITINAADNAGFSYSASSYEPTDADPTPTITGLTGGTFSGTTGLVINSTTGEIDLSASTVATHTITYDTTSSGSSVCPNTSTQTVEIALSGISNVYSMSFDGVNDFIQSTSAIISGNIDRTVSLWYKMNGSLTTRDTLMTLGVDSDATPTKQRFGISIQGSQRIRAFIYVGDPDFNNTYNWGSIDLLDGNWHHVVLSYSNNNYKLYVDNTHIGTITPSPSHTLNTSDGITIGGNWLGSSVHEPINASIDEVAIWNTALTSTQVAEIYNATGTNLTKDLTTVSGSNLVYWNRMGD
jgi:hypothetical protein